MEKEVLGSFLYVMAGASIILFLDLAVIYSIVAKHTLGIVIDISKNRRKGMVHYAPQVEFKSEGHSYRFIDDIESTKNHYNIGQSVKVEYLKGYETHARIPNFQRKLMALAMVALFILGAYAFNEKYGRTQYAQLVATITTFLIAIKVIRRYLK